ncbi:MAG: hypothetical protein AB7J13_04070 [Pyrinomonadaceae bacterium]
MEPILSAFDEQFRHLDRRSRELLALLTDETLFQRARIVENSMAPFSCGEFLLRSAAMVEKTFGGITTRLWDDPFEWTLPEKLSNGKKISAYLDEVEATRVAGFNFFSGDADLTRSIPAPETLTPIGSILLETLSKAEHFQGRAFAVFQMLSNEKLPRR